MFIKLKCLIFDDIKEYFKLINTSQELLQLEIGKGFDSSKIDDYVKALEGLDIAQQKAVLTSSALTKEEQKQILERITNNAVTKAGVEVNLDDAKSDMMVASSNKVVTETIEEQNEAKIISNALTKEGTEENIKEVITDNIDSTSNIIDVLIDGVGKKITDMKGIFSGIGQFFVKYISIIAKIGIPVILAAGAAWLHYKNSAKGVIAENQKVIDSNKELYDSIKSELDEFSNKASNLSSLYDDYLSAAKGTEEYYNIANKIAELSPELVIGYDNEGNAILANNNKIEDQIEYYKQLNEEKRESLRLNAVENISDEAGNYQVLKDKKESKEGELERYKNELSTLQELQSINPLSLLQEDYERLNKLPGLISSTEQDVKDLSKQLETAGSSLRGYYTDLLPTEDDLTDVQKVLRQGLIETAVEESFSAQQFDEAYKSLFDSEVVNKYASQILQLDEALTDEEYRKQALFIYDKLASEWDATDEEKQAFKVAFGIDDKTIAEAEETRNNNEKSIRSKLHISEDTKNEINTWLESLSNEDISKLAFFGKFDRNTTKEDLENLLKELNDESEDNTVEVKTSINVLSGIQTLSDDLSKLDGIYADIINGKEFDYSSILNNTEFNEAFGELDEYENFIETIMSSPNDISKCQSAFNNLTTAYINNKGALDGLTEETKEQSIAMLEQMGIANAREVIEAELANSINSVAEAEELAKLHSLDLANITATEIEALYTEGAISLETSKALSYYAIQKMLANGTQINTVEDCQQIINLAKAAGFSAELLADLENIMAAFNDPILSSKSVDEINNKIQIMLTEASKGISFDLPEFEFNGGTATENALKDAESQYEDLLDKYLNYYEAQLDTGLIDLNSYLNQSKNLVEQYYAEGKISAEKYWDSLKAIYEKQLDVYDKVLSAVDRRYDKEIEKIQDAIDEVEKQNEALEKQKDEYDGILSTVENVYDTKIDSIKEEQDAIQDTIDKLQEENDERQRQIDLEKARYQLSQDLNNRNVKLFNGTEFVYTANAENIKEAQQNLADLELENTIHALEKEKEALDKEIETLEEFKQKWQEVANVYETEVNKQLAIALWGENYEEMILSNRISDIEDFKNNYVSIQEKIEDNQGLIDSYNEKIEYYESLKEQWSEIANVYKNAQEDMLAAQVLGANWEADILSGRVDLLNTFASDYTSIQQTIDAIAIQSTNARIQAINDEIGAINRRIKAYEEEEKARKNISYNLVDPVVEKPVDKNSVGQATYKGVYVNYSTAYTDTGTGTSNKTITVKTPISSYLTGETSSTSSSYAAALQDDKKKKYGTGTDNATPGIHEIAETGDEIIIDNHGRAFLAEGHQLHVFEGGEIVKKPSETRELLSNNNRLIPIQNFFDNIDTSAFVPNMQNIIPKVNVPKYDFSTIGRDSGMMINIGDIHLHEVSSVDSLADAIIRELPNKINQRINRKF